MTAIDASFDEVSLQNGSEGPRSLLWMLPWGIALAFGAGTAVWLPDGKPTSALDFSAPRLASHTALTPVAALANPYGPLVVFAREATEAAELVAHQIGRDANVRR